MSKRFDALAHQLTGKASLEECSIDEMRQFAVRYPYFSSAQFLYLQKLKQEGAADWEKQQNKAVLFYPDPLQFDYFISADNFYETGEASSEALLSPHTDAEIYAKEQPNEVESFVNTSIFNSPVNTSENEATIVKNNEDENLNDVSLNEDVALPSGNENNVEAASPELNVELEDVSSEDIIQDKNDVSAQEPNLSLSSLTAVPKTPANSEELLFEPFHTVDYFASQGIKISQEELPKDKLGKQLKSFTAWLKTMKRLPVVQNADPVENPAEKKVQTMATDSVTDSNVITEAMAEVWIKQGNKEKALDIYKKLSLLNPSKTAYFAAKIENLKTS